MRKFTLLIVSLFFTIGAMAQEANKYYSVVAKEHSKGGEPAWAVNNDTTNFVSTGNTEITNDAQKYFAFINYNDKVYIYSLFANKFVKKDATLVTQSPDAVTVEPLSDGRYFFKFDNDHVINIGGEKQMTIDDWGGGSKGGKDAGNQYTLIEEDDFNPFEVKKMLYVKSRRFVKKVAVNGVERVITDTEKVLPHLNDTANTKFTVFAGSTVSLLLEDDGNNWMNAYAYVDREGDGFTAGIADDGYTPTGDLVSYSHYSGDDNNDDNNQGKNSAGTNKTNDNRNTIELPTFVAPSRPGTYCIRFKYDWNSIDPLGDSNTTNGDFFSNSGSIMDFTLVVLEPVYHTVTYNYKDGDMLVARTSHTLLEDSDFPALYSNAYGVTVTGSKPTGKVTEDGNYDITVDLAENYPFEYALTYDEIGNKWYNLIMHSNWNTGGGGAARYRTYVGKDNGETLAWGTQRSLTNPSDDYFWAFVGDPFNGFRVVNKGKGEGYILSSSNPAENNDIKPLLLEENNLPDGYNTIWNIAARKYDTSREGDYILEGAWFCLNYPNSTKYMNANAGNGNVAFWTDNDNGSAILAVKPLEIKAAADVATYYSNNYIKIPLTLGTVYYADQVNDGKYLHLEQITGDVPAGNGVIVKCETENNIVYAPEITSKGTTAPINDNKLKGSTKSIVIDKDTAKEYYVLWLLENNEVGMCVAGDGTETNSTFMNSAYKAYLELPAGTVQQNSSSLRFDFSGTTAIEEVVVENNEEVIYDLQGRRVSEITKAGIYIVNGHKVLVK